MECLTGCLRAGGWPLWIGIAATALPSLVTALAPMPKAAGWAKALMAVVDRLSVLTHRDAAGTLKWPLVQASKPPASAA